MNHFSGTSCSRKTIFLQLDTDELCSLLFKISSNITMEETHVERISDDSEPSEDDCEEELVLAMPKRKEKDLAPV